MEEIVKELNDIERVLGFICIGVWFLAMFGMLK